MKLKTLVGSMALLGLMSTGVSAAVVAQTTGHAVANTGSDFWKGVMFRNQDNNGTMPTLAAGQYKVTGEVAMDYFHSDRRLSFADTKPNNKGESMFALHTAELYFDYNINDMASAHVALDYDNNTLTTDSSKGTESKSTDTYTISATTLTEAYATLKQDNYYLNAGLQYLNFGSAAHDTILTPLVEEFAQVNTVALTGGAFNLGNTGLYANASVYNGAPYGSDNTEAATDSKYNAHGLSAELGYAMNEGVNPFYGFNGLNTYVDYLSDVADTGGAQVVRQTTGTNLPSKHYGVAAHVGYVTGPFQVYADYVAVMKEFEKTTYSINGDSAKPSAYGIEADYSWNTANVQTISLAFDGTKDAAGLQESGAYGPTGMPENRISLSYGYHVSKQVVLQGEYANEKDYGTGTSYALGSNTGAGTGKSANLFVGRLKVAF